MINTEVLEYSYEDKTTHIREADVLKNYKEQKTLYPNAVVTVDNLDCGHWRIETFKTEEQKQVFYKKKLSKMVSELLNRFR